MTGSASARAGSGPWTTWSALLAFTVYVLGSLALGERFPFSRYGLGTPREPWAETALPLLKSEGSVCRPRDFVAFHGVEASDYGPPPGIHAAAGSRHRDGRNWIDARITDVPRPDGVPIEVGYVLLKRAADGLWARTEVIVSRGTAWRR